MENEQFQQLVLDKLGELAEGQKRLEGEFSVLKNEVSVLKNQVRRLEEKVDHIQKQTAELLEFKNEVKDTMRDIADTQAAITAILGEHEVQIRKIVKLIV